MNTEDVRSLYQYNDWANARVVGVVETLAPDQRTATIVSSFPSVLATLGHVVGAEWIWLERWRGRNPSSFPEWLENPTLEDLQRRLAGVESDRRAFLDGLGERELEEDLQYNLLSGAPGENRLLDLLLHVVNHSTYHRGQLTTMFRQLGVDAVALDYVLFKRQP